MYELCHVLYLEACMNCEDCGLCSGGMLCLSFANFYFSWIQHVELGFSDLLPQNHRESVKGADFVYCLASGFGSRSLHLLVVRLWTSLQLFCVSFQRIIVARLDELLHGKFLNSAWHIVQLKNFRYLYVSGILFVGRQDDGLGDGCYCIPLC